MARRRHNARKCRRGVVVGDIDGVANEGKFQSVSLSFISVNFRSLQVATGDQ